MEEAYWVPRSTTATGARHITPRDVTSEVASVLQVFLPAGRPDADACRVASN